jgi:hypothetical protein
MQQHFSYSPQARCRAAHQSPLWRRASITAMVPRINHRAV